MIDRITQVDVAKSLSTLRLPTPFVSGAFMMSRLYNYVALFIAALVLLFFVDEDYNEVTALEWALLATLAFSAIEIFKIILQAGRD